MSVNAVAPPHAPSESEIKTLLLAYRRQNWARIQPAEWHEKIADALLRDDGESVLSHVQAVWAIPRNAAVLDVGSGVGSFVVACRRRGLRAFGIEPDRIGQGSTLTAIQIAARRAQEPLFAAAVGEYLPFAEQSFDLVTMNQVLEHVSDQASVLREAARVVKAGGAIYIACPNYLRLYEPHYKIFWLPMLPKFMGRAYLRLRGRDPVMLDQLSYTTNARLRRLFSELGDEYQSVDLHARGFLAKCLRGSFARRWVRTAAKMMKLPLIGNVLQRAVLRFLALREGGSEFVIVRRGVRDTAC